MNDIIQLKITLQWTKPPIWRRVLVDKKTTFFKLHHIIQISMGWDNYHLYEFNINKNRIGEPNEEFDYYDDSKVVDASTVTLDSIINDTKEKFEYEYDFGDGWRHQIVVEKFLSRDSSTSYPICIDGKLNCPPEDCGGVGGFYQLLDTIEDKKHPEREEMLEWLGGHYEAEHFDKNEINQELATLDKYIKEWGDHE
jgi:Plasmid pRiA4b ORF-3-like protein